MCVYMYIGLYIYVHVLSIYFIIAYSCKLFYGFGHVVLVKVLTIIYFELQAVRRRYALRNCVNSNYFISILFLFISNCFLV